MCKLEKRHFELIAMTIAGFVNDTTRKQVALAFAKQLAATNPKFDRSKFLKYCGVTE